MRLTLVVSQLVRSVEEVNAATAYHNSMQSYQKVKQCQVLYCICALWEAATEMC